MTLRRQLAAQATAIAALMRRLGLAEAQITSEEIDAAEGEVGLDVERDAAGGMTGLRVRFEPTPLIFERTTARKETRG